jgi:transforming growth factor-beta-induced protein
MESNRTIVQIASEDPRFSILVEAVVKADLATTLGMNREYTVFAPTNDAFEMLFNQIGVAGISELSKEQLTLILLYHVVEGKVMSSDVRTGEVATMNRNASLDIKVYNTGIEINKKTKVIIPDIKASNGVIHVIDRVLLP